MMYDPEDPEALERVEAAGVQILDLACRLGGTLSGEHGIGISKAAYMNLEHSPDDLNLMLSLKQALDPNGILNPGKLGLEGRR